MVKSLNYFIKISNQHNPLRIIQSLGRSCSVGDQIAKKYNVGDYLQENFDLVIASVEKTEMSIRRRSVIYIRI